jgi:hypothetical protein
MFRCAGQRFGRDARTASIHRNELGVTAMTPAIAGRRLGPDGLADGSDELAEEGNGPPEQFFQMARSVHSGFTASVGGNSIPAAPVALVPCSK